MGEFTNIGGVKFRWDDRKDKINFRKHGLHFKAATKVFEDEYRLDFNDDEHSIDEDRFITIGKADDVLFVVYAEWFDSQDAYDIRYIRLISARVAEEDEEAEYYEHRAFLLGGRSQTDGGGESRNQSGETET